MSQIRIHIACELPIALEESVENIQQVQSRLLQLSSTVPAHVSVAQLVIAKMRNTAASVQQPLNLETDPLPTLDEIAELVYGLKICFCTDNTPRSGILRVLSHMLSWQLTVWPCGFIQIAHQIMAELGHLPTVDDVRAAIRNQHAALNGTAEDVPKTVTPTDIRRYVQNSGLTNDDVCSLCCNIMTDFTLENNTPRPNNIRRHYVLPCGHKFHFHEAFCITGTVSKWFETHNQCPVCRHVIE